jgi:hypothetical protein
MNSWDKWRVSVEKKLQRTFYFASSLFEDRLTSYAVYRLKYYFARFLLQIAVYLTEFFLLSYIFSEKLLIKAVFMRLCFMLFTGFWWGALEQLREKVRTYVHGGDKHLVKHALSRWASFSLVISCLYLISSSALLYKMWGQSSDKNLFALYVFALNFRLAIQISLTTFHSGIYAITRIYRPAWSILCFELTGFVLTLALWPFFHKISFPIATILNSFLVCGIFSYYLNKAYSLIDYMKVSISRNYFLAALKTIAWKDVLSCGVANALIKCDGIIISGIMYALSKDIINFNNINFYVVLVPFLNALSNWAYLFYFDFKKLEVSSFTMYEKKFKKTVLIMSIILAVGFWSFYFVVSSFLPYSFNFIAALCLIPIFIFRSLFAYCQVRAFSERRFTDIFVSAGLLIGFVLLAAVFNFNIHLKAGGVIFLISTLPFYLLLNVFTRNSKLAGILSSPHPFFMNLNKRKGAVRYGYIRLAEGGSSQMRNSIANNLAKRMAGKAIVCSIGNLELLWFDITTKKLGLNAEDLLITCSGMAEKIEIRTSNGASEAVKVLSNFISSTQDERPEKGIFKYFLRLFPQGKIIFSKKEGILGGQKEGTYIDNIQGAFQYLKSLFPSRPGNGVEITALMMSDTLEAVFIVPLKSSESRRKKWLKVIKGANLKRLVAG